MYTGGKNYTPQAAQIIRYAGIIVPSLLVIYGALIEYGFIARGDHYQPTMFAVFSSLLLLVGVVQFLRSSRTALESALKIIAFHVVAAGYFVFVTGLMTPLIASWILLMIAANIYFDKKGVWISIGIFSIVVLIDIVLLSGGTSATMIGDLVVLTAILFCGLAVITINQYAGIDRSELERSRELEALQRDRIMTLVNNLADAILSTDKYGVIRVYNAACLNLLDTNNNLNGRHIDEILRLTDKHGEHVSLFDTFKNTKGVVTRDDLEHSFDEEEKIRLEITHSPIRSSDSHAKTPGTDGYIIIMRDITKSKSLEEERDEFISVVSHELRTPITIAEGTISNVQLMMQHPDATPEMLSDALKNTHEQIVFLAKMVNDLSTLSRAERGIADTTEVIDLASLASNLHSKYEPEAREKNLMFNLDLSPKLGSVIASRLYLEELLQNFITNALKYTKEGTITLSIQRKKNLAVFNVKDSGIGISKSDQKRIFEKFYRSEDYRTRETGGTGLGLYVAAKLAHKLHTHIELTSRLNHGSSFGFSLPVIDERNQRS